ncbi:MAG: hypothetical protein KDB80_14335, partial [Planctomycetes bacterium]|nr:hypothetical protein [Planctomycetota bacterium]
MGAKLDLEVFEEKGEHVVSGVLRGADGTWFPVLDGVPCFLTGTLRPDLTEFAARHGLAYDASEGSAAQAEQKLTNQTFSDKWRRFKQYGLEPDHQDFLFEWYTKKLGLASRDELVAFYRAKRRTLEVGPGSGFNSAFMAKCAPAANVF